MTGIRTGLAGGCSSGFRRRGSTSGWGSSGIMVHGCIDAELSAVVVAEVVTAAGDVKPWQKAAAEAATQSDNDSFMVDL